MSAHPVLIVEVLPQDELVLEVRYAAENESGPVRLPRCDLLYAMLCTEGARLTIPCRVMNKEKPCRK